MAISWNGMGLVLSLASVGLAGYAIWTMSDNARAAQMREGTEAALEARLAALEATLKPPAGAHAPALAPAPTSHGAATPHARVQGEGAAPAPGSATSGAPATLPDVAQRVAALEQQLKAALETAVAPAQQEVTMPQGAEVATTWYGSVDDVAKGLALTAPQKADFERAVLGAKLEIDQLHKVPDESGKTWEQAMKDGVSVENGNISYDGSKIQAFREKVIPGRNESFGAADRRLRAEAKQRMRESLSRDQQDKFDKSHVDGLLPGGDAGDGGFMTMFTSFGGGINLATPVEVAAPSLPPTPAK